MAAAQGTCRFCGQQILVEDGEGMTEPQRDEYNHTIQVPSGWYLDKESIREAWHEVTGFMYFTYTLVKNGKKRKQKKRDTYSLNLETGEIEITENQQAERN